MSNHQDPTSTTFNQRIDSLCINFDAVADECHHLQIDIEDPTIDALLTLLLGFENSVLLSLQEISTAAAAFKAAIPALEHTKPLLEAFSLRATSAQNAFRWFMDVEEDADTMTLAQMLRPERRERHVKFFGAAAINGGCLKEANVRLEMVTGFLDLAMSDDIGSEQWAINLV